MPAFKSYREQSKVNWGTNQEERPTLEKIQLGCLLRIADATEIMSKNYNQLLSDVRFYKELSESRLSEIEHLTRSRNSMKGEITKLRNKVAELSKPDVSDLDKELIDILKKNENGYGLLYAVKHHKQKTGSFLKEAKQYVDSLKQKHNL